ncbi:hypothetical protein GWE_01475 [Chlamydia psittaci NJ1]|nr:hypothetical protein B712_0620 [Chlamydia psittaci NJ1]KPZ38312.1 hypothetical protein GWE_01475 [Chlamydia psittaci NJ1]
MEILIIFTQIFLKKFQKNLNENLGSLLVVPFPGDNMTAIDEFMRI